MGSLLLIRHVETEYDTDKGEKSEGWRDIPPSAEGRKQAEAVARSLKDTPITEVISSDLQRNKILGRAIAAQTGAPFSTSRNLRSVNVGSLAGKYREENKPLIKYHRAHPDQPFPGGGETFRTYVKRWLSGELPQLEKRAEGKDGYLAGITHSHNIADAYEWLTGKPLKDQPPTGSIWLVDGKEMKQVKPEDLNGENEESEEYVKEPAGAADYEELEDAVKDAECEIVAVPGGVSSEGGCCKRWKRANADVEFFRCGTCIYLEEL